MSETAVDRLKIVYSGEFDEIRKSFYILLFQYKLMVPKNGPLISVIVPTYNEGMYIGDLLK